MLCAREREGLWKLAMMGRLVAARDNQTRIYCSRTIPCVSQMQYRGVISPYPLLSSLSFSHSPALLPSLSRTPLLPHATSKLSHLNILLMTTLAVGEIALGLEV